METAVHTFELRPAIKTILKSDHPEIGLKKGQEVTLSRASVGGSLVKVNDATKYLAISEFDQEIRRQISAQAARGSVVIDDVPTARGNARLNQRSH